MSYKQNAAANRDALFAGAGGGGGGGGYKKKAADNRNELFGGAPSSKTSTSKTAAPSSAAARNRVPTTRTTTTSSRTSAERASAGTRPTLSGEARAAKLKEADEYRKAAKKCMTRGVFSRPDPVSAGMYYKRAADAYQACGEYRLERIHRMASADCQLALEAYATAASEYSRAAELILMENVSVEEKRQESSRLYSEAASAYLQMNEKGKAGKSMVQAAMAWTYEDDSNVLEKRALVAMEEAVEFFVPDLLNRNARYRQTGTTASEEQPSKDDLAMARNHLVTTSYAHEPVLDMVNLLIQCREYPAALYAIGAACAILEADGISTLTLGRTYVVETIILLAMGDPVAAEKVFLSTHVQQTSYLTSRECRLAEDLFRAILQRDEDALEETRSSRGPNRAALANLHPSVRDLVLQLRISGAAKKNISTNPPQEREQPVQRQPVQQPTIQQPAPEETTPNPEEVRGDVDQLHSEMDDLFNDMGLASDEEEELDDDELDLR